MRKTKRIQTALILLNQNDSQKCFDPRKIGRKHPKNQLKLQYINLLFPPPKSSYSSFRPNRSPQATQLGIGDFPRSKKGQGTSNGSSNFPWRMRAAISSQFPLGCRRRLKSQKYYSQVYNVFAIIAKLPFGTLFKYLKTLCFNATCWYAGFQVCQGL